jgi:hypothetical protein
MNYLMLSFFLFQLTFPQKELETHKSCQEENDAKGLFLSFHWEKKQEMILF